MRLFTISDLHVDYAENLQWVRSLDALEYRNDVLLCAGDLSANIDLFRETLDLLRKKFMRVFFVPGNHDIWVRKSEGQDSIQKFETLLKYCAESGVDTTPDTVGDITLVPIFSWYDFSFAALKPELKKRWADFRMCSWPAGMEAEEVTRWFHNRSEIPESPKGRIVSFSHFMPTLQALPARIDPVRYLLTSILGSESLGNIVQSLNPVYHIFGHSHVNNVAVIGNTTYINNAFGYPNETKITRKRLIQIDPI